MKKIILSLALILVLIASGLVAYQFNIDKEISNKIEELNNNGFMVKHNQNTNYIKTTANGELEIIYPDKVASYIFKNIDNEDLKSNLTSEYNKLNSNEKELFFEGIKFEYDFVLNNFTNKFDSNIYLTHLSKKTMYNLSQNNYDLTNQWLLDFVKNKKLQMYINEKKEYKIVDIDTLIPNEVFITIRDIKGVDGNLSISYMKISDANIANKGLIQIDNLNLDYFKDLNNENSKFAIKNIYFEEKDKNFNLKNLVLKSHYQKDLVNITSKNEISFDEVVVKEFNQEITNLKKSSLLVDISNLPINKLEEIRNYLENEKFEEYLKSIIESGLIIDLKGNASSYKINNQNIFETLIFDSNMKLNKNVDFNNVSDLENILENAKLTIDIDVQAAQNIQTLFNTLQKSEVTFIDGVNNLKRFEVVLNGDEVFVNNKKVFDKKDLKPKAIEPQVLDSLSYNYEMLEDNKLKLNIRYSPTMSTFSSGGISISFPQLKDTSRMIDYKTQSFEEINFYDANSEIWNGGLEKNILSSYLLVEGWDDNWADYEEKKLTLIIDVKDLESLIIYLRAGALNDIDSRKKRSEIVPEDGELDQQNYPVNVIEIPFFKAK
uniref:hypothetical protein n=1 Tax=Aliarcobacter sp. TaxID=2321116 RepID=UPI0040475BE4